MPTEYLLAWAWHILHGLHTNWHTQVSWMMYAFAASCKVRRANGWNLRLPHCSWAISLTHLAKGYFLIRKPVDFWNLQISCRAMVPSLNLIFFFFPFSFTAATFFPPSHFLFLFQPWDPPPFSCLCIYAFLLMYSMTQTILLDCSISLYCTFTPDNYNCANSLGKRHSVKKFKMTCCHDALMSDMVITPCFNFISHHGK